MNHKHSKTNNQSQTTNNQLQTTKKELRKIHSFMQNKPNLLNARMNVSKVLAKDYENVHPLGHPKTNPKQTQFKPNTNSERGADPYGQASRNPQTGDQYELGAGRRSLRASFSESSNRGPIQTQKARKMPRIGL